MRLITSKIAAFGQPSLPLILPDSIIHPVASSQRRIAGTSFRNFYCNLFVHTLPRDVLKFVMQRNFCLYFKFPLYTVVRLCRIINRKIFLSMEESQVYIYIRNCLVLGVCFVYYDAFFIGKVSVYGILIQLKNCNSWSL